MTTLQIRPMTRAELELGIEWAAQEGWNPGLHDADTFHATDPGGFLMGVLDAEPVGMVSAVRYGARFGFLGLYLVRPAWRGQGHGLALWHAAIERLRGRVIGLDGVVAQQANYSRSGFALAWNNVRYQGVLRGGGPAAAHVVPLSGLPVEAVLAYDARFFPDDRRAFTARWIAQTGSRALAVWRAQRIAGYGVIRPCRSGFKIGPLFADDAAAASELFTALAATVPAGQAVQIDIPAPNPAATALVETHGLAPVFETARMYAGARPALPIERLFGVTSFELG
jgi:GNAT superfamily N-acetyltransferase